MPKNKKLTDKQERFCQEYIIDLNATRACQRAGYSKSTAEQQGSRLLSNAKVSARIQHLKSTRSEKLEVSAEAILQELKNFAYADITQTMCLSLDEIKALPAEIRRMISSFKETISKSGSSIEIKFIDKSKAIDMINRHIGFYEVDNKQREINLGDISSIKIVRPGDGDTSS